MNSGSTVHAVRIGTSHCNQLMVKGRTAFTVPKGSAALMQTEDLLLLKEYDRNMEEYTGTVLPAIVTDIQGKWVFCSLTRLPKA